MLDFTGSTSLPSSSSLASFATKSEPKGWLSPVRPQAHQNRFRTAGLQCSEGGFCESPSTTSPASHCCSSDDFGVSVAGFSFTCSPPLGSFLIPRSLPQPV